MRDGLWGARPLRPSARASFQFYQGSPPAATRLASFLATRCTAFCDKAHHQLQHDALLVMSRPASTQADAHHACQSRIRRWGGVAANLSFALLSIPAPSKHTRRHMRTCSAWLAAASEYSLKPSYDSVATGSPAAKPCTPGPTPATMLTLSKPQSKGSLDCASAGLAWYLTQEGTHASVRACVCLCRCVRVCLPVCRARGV